MPALALLWDPYKTFLQTQSGLNNHQPVTDTVHNAQKQNTSAPNKPNNLISWIKGTQRQSTVT